MWHASVSALHRRHGRINDPAMFERNAIAALVGVGNDREWWHMNDRAMVGHLRVGLTVDEVALLDPWTGTTDDAGESGPERRRTR